MSQTTNFTANAGDGLWETAGNWDNGVPVSADDTVVNMLVDNGGAGMGGPVAACTIGSFTCTPTASGLNNAFDNLTVLTFVSVTDVNPGSFNFDASAVNGAMLSGIQFNGAVGDGATFDNCTVDGIYGNGCQFANGSISNTAGADYTSFTNGSSNQFSTGDHTTYDSGSYNAGDDGDDVVFNGDSFCQTENSFGLATFNDNSSLTGGTFAGTLNWNSTGICTTDTTELVFYAIPITITTPLAMTATANTISTGNSTVFLNLLDVSFSLIAASGGGGIDLTNGGITIEDSMTGDELVSSIGSTLIASGVPASSLMTQAQTDVETALTAQGYTTARAANLDNLDAAVSSRSTYSGGAVASVTGSVGSVTSPVTVGTLPNPAPAGYGAQASAGSDRCTLTLGDGATPTPHPIANASVWITSDAGGDQVVAGVTITDSDGHAAFLLTAGDTYYLWMERDGFNPILGQEFVAVADS